MDRNRIAVWSTHLMDALPVLNSRMVKVYGYTLAEILMGFNPQKKHYDLENTRMATYEDFEIVEPLPSHVAQLHSMLHNEIWEWSTEVFTITNAAVEAHEQGIFPNWQHGRFLEGDLVLVQDFQKEKNKGMKFKPRWTSLQILEAINPGGRTMRICKLYSHNIQKVHLDDVRPYHQQTADFDHPQRHDRERVAVIPALEVERSAIVMATVAGVHAVDLYSV